MELLDGAGMRVEANDVRGLDHGAWVPLRLAWPEAHIPIVQVSLPLQGTGALTVPTNVLLFRGEGPRVAAVGEDGKVQLRSVKIGRNYGEVVELLDGVGANDRLVLNPADSLNDGDPVVISQK